MQVREGRPKTTSTIDNNPNPVWNEEFDFIVDDPVSHVMSNVMSHATPRFGHEGEPSHGNHPTPL